MPYMEAEISSLLQILYLKKSSTLRGVNPLTPGAHYKAIPYLIEPAAESCRFSISIRAVGTGVGERHGPPITFSHVNVPFFLFDKGR